MYLGQRAAETWRSWKTESTGRPRCTFATSTGIGSDFQTRQNRSVDLDRRLDTQSTELQRCPSHTRNNLRSAVDYRHDARERRRHLQVLQSNRTLEAFMRALRQEKEARATAALFSSTPGTFSYRQRPRTISFAAAADADQSRHRPVMSSAVTSSRDGTGSSCRRCGTQNKPARSIMRCSSPTGRLLSSNAALQPRLNTQRQQLTGISKWSNAPRDFEDCVNLKCLDEDRRRRRTFSPRPAR